MSIIRIFFSPQGEQKRLEFAISYLVAFFVLCSLVVLPTILRLCFTTIETSHAFKLLSALLYLMFSIFWFYTSYCLGIKRLRNIGFIIGSSLPLVLLVIPYLNFFSMLFLSLYPSKKICSSTISDIETKKMCRKNKILRNTFILYIISFLICYFLFSSRPPAPEAIPGDIFMQAFGGGLWALLYTIFAYSYRKIRSQI